MRTAALYIRVSTDKQEELSPDAQKRLLIEYAEKHGILISEQYIFMEGGISGKKADKRPKFQQMIGLAKSKNHPFDVILVWKFSRFARNQEESIVYKSLLKQNNIDVISISEPLIDGPFGSLIERIIEWMDEYYSIRLAGEVYRGMTEKALKGGYQASPPLGYKIVHAGELPEIVPGEAEIVKTIFQKYVVEGLTLFQIARYLNALGFKTKQGKNFERRSVEYIIQNPMYKGYIRWNRVNNATKEIKDESEWITEKGQHEQIISEELFDQAQKKFTTECTPSKARPVTEYKHWLSGLIKCSNCGRSMTASKVKQSRFMHFTCNGYTKGKCPVCNSVSENQLIPAILGVLQKVISSGEVEYTVAKRVTNSSDTYLLEQQLLRLDEKYKRIKAAYINGIDTLKEYKHNKELIQKESDSLNNQLKELKKTMVQDNNQEMVNRINSVYKLITDDKIDNLTKNASMKSIIEKIVFNKKEGLLDVFFYYD
ncbi:MAG: hypothetical protein K0S41_1243 [Anaerocolumna sp.]|jgi:DNA invertase Pin-like site-specific DNA recombinase|nr:hypothetical protein [Anaerocolumna sp.]